MENLIGRQFGAYRIVAPLGEGGMATVYKAYQASIDRYVALKILPRHFASDPGFVQRFEREAKVIAQLEHPHILPVHDFGEADGYTYLVMRFVKGGDLASVMASSPLSPAQISKYMTELASALDYAHSKGVVHRDIKPGNVLIDEQGNCLLSDFGLAKIMISDSKLTASGAFIGTPTYASPEQCMGNELDARSDIYSLGVVLYEMVTGRPPFQADTPMGIVLKHISDPLPLPSSVNPNVSEAVERVILKALAKTPADRFQTAGELASALRANLTENGVGTGENLVTTVTAQPPASKPPVSSPPGQRTPPPGSAAAGRKPTPLALGLGCLGGGAAVLLLALGIVAFILITKGTFSPSHTPTKTGLPTVTLMPVSQATLPVVTLNPVAQATLPAPTSQLSASPRPTGTPTVKPTPTVTRTPNLTPPTATNTPLPQMAWVNIPGLPGGVNAVLVDPADANTIYIGTGKSSSGTGVYRSQDGGRTWKRMAEGLPSEAVVGLVIAPQSKGRLYAVCGNSLYASDDQAQSWKLLSEVMGSYAGFSNQLIASSDGQLLFGVPGSQGVFRSTNQGAAWQASNDGLPPGYNNSTFVQSLAVAPSDANIVYAGTGERWEYANGVFKSTDGGQTWKASNAGMLDIGITALAVDPRDANVVYAGAYSGELFKSTDGGTTWQNLIKRSDSGFQNGIYTIQINPSQPDQIFIVDSDRGVLTSPDGGAKWTMFGKPSDQVRQPYSMAPLGIVYGLQPTVFTGSDGQGLWVYALTDFLQVQPTPTLQAVSATLAPLPGSGQWEQMQGLPNSINTVVLDPSNPLVVYAGTGDNGSGAGVYKSEDGGATWKQAMSGLPSSDVRALAWSGKYLVAVAGEGLYLTQDGGASWQPTSGNNSRIYTEDLVASPDGQTLFVWYGGSGLYKSSDRGVNWMQITEGLPKDTNNSAYVDALAVDPKNTQVLYAGTGYNHQSGNGVFKSMDGGATWTPANANMLDKNVTALAVDPNDSNIVYAGVDGGGLYKSADGGQNWSLIRDVGQTFSDWVQSIIIDPQTGRIYMICDQEGFMASGDGGLHWQIFGRPGDAFANDVKAASLVLSNDVVFFISTHDNGLWRYQVGK